MTFEEFTNNKLAIITRNGYIYNRDKTLKTTDKKLAASWYNCKEEDLITIESYPWRSTGVFFEEDPNVPEAIKISYWKLENLLPSDGRQVSARRIGCFYLYNDGKVSYAVGCNSEHPEIPKRVRTRPAPLSREIDVWGWDCCQYMSPLNINNTWRGASLGEEVINMLKRKGFLLKFTVTKCNWTIEITKNSNYGDLADWIANYPSGKKVSQTEFTKLKEAEMFSPLPENVFMKIEKTDQGSLIRIREAKEVYNWNKNKYEKIIGEENRRILFTNKGTCSKQIKMDDKWIRDASQNYNFLYKTIISGFNLSDWKIEGSFQDFFSENKKFKYLNSCTDGGIRWR